jgi:PAS domain S-box-containing protein
MEEKLRKAAEAVLLSTASAALPGPGSAAELLHELQVYRIELEMQNDALRQSQILLEQSRDRYVDLYEFAPVGYLTLTRAGQVAEINLTGANLLGIERQKLIGYYFRNLITKADRTRWHAHFSSVLQRAEGVALVVSLQKGEGPEFRARLDCLRITSDEGLQTVRIAVTDITRQHQAEAGLRLRDAALNAAAAPMVITSLEGNIEWANPAFSALTGYQFEEILGRNPREISKSGKHGADVYDKLWRTILAGEVWQGELINRRRDGTLYNEFQTITPVRDGDGALSRFIAVKQDITERKQLGALLFESEERYRLIFEMSADAVFLIQARDGIILAANHSASYMLGYHQEQLCALHFTHLQDATDTRWTGLSERSDQPGLARSEVRCVRRNGETFCADVSLIRFHNAMGELHAVVQIRDVSLQVEAENRLHESELRWQFAVESRGDAMWDWDAVKDELFLTAAAKELFDLPDTDSERPIADMISQMRDEDRATVRKHIDDILAGRTTDWLGEYRLSKPGKSLCWVATRGRVMTRTADGRPHRIVGISSDITNRKYKEADVRRQRDLISHQARLVLLGELASALVHEINQPLSAIASYTAACARRLAGIPDVLEIVRAIEEQALRAGDIAWRMRNFARRERLGRGALSVHEVASKVARWMLIDTDHQNATIDIAGIESDLPNVFADRVELEQVLVNLMRNGIQATPLDRVSPRIAISGQLGERPDEIQVSITDWGSGLPPGSAFDPMRTFQTTKDFGMGLGLSICHSIIEGHEGRLWATPNPEGGTVFHFTLPIAGPALLP